MTSMVKTRQSELMRVLGLLADDLDQPFWVALLDQDGLILACVPALPEMDTDRISAMAAAVVSLSDRVMLEFDGGTLRYTAIVGEERLNLTLKITHERLLSMGLRPDYPLNRALKPLGRRVPELFTALNLRF